MRNHKKHQTISRLLSWLLISAMTLTLLPLQGFAAAGERPSDSPGNGGVTDSIYQVAEDSLAMAELLSRIGLMSADKGNTAQSDDLYIIDGRRYKVIYNDYIACYVEAATGGYTILPTAIGLTSPSALGISLADSLGGAVFNIDGGEYVFGGDYPAKNSYLFRPEVRGDMLVTHWNLGDYIISQYQAITQDVSRENSYAVKVAYAAEYFGPSDTPSEISGRLILPARLGDDGKAPLVTGDGGLLLGGTVLAPVPDEIWMNGGDGPRTFFVLNEHQSDLPAPERMALGDRAELLAGGEPEQFAELSDPAASFTFAPRTLIIPKEGAADLNSNLCAFLVNYGYYNLIPAELSLTVDEAAARESAALSELTLGLLAAGETASLYFDIYANYADKNPVPGMDANEAVKLTDLTWQRPDDENPTRVSVSGEGLRSGTLATTQQTFDIPTGATVRFGVDWVSPGDGERLDLGVNQNYHWPSGSEGNTEFRALAPDADGMYEFVMQSAADEATVEFRVAPKPGYAALNWNHAAVYWSPVPVTVSDWNPSRFAVAPGETVSMTLNGDVPFYLYDAAASPEHYPGLYYYKTGDDHYDPAAAVAFDSAQARYPDEYGVLPLSFTVPNAQGITEVGIDWYPEESDYHNTNYGNWRYASVSVIPRDAVAGGLLSLSGGSWMNGIFRAASGTTITVAVPTLANGYDANSTYLSVFDTYFGEAVAISYGSSPTTTDEPVSLQTLNSASAGVVTFTMPDSDVAVRLAAATYPNVLTEVKYTNSSDTAISLADYDGPKVAVTLLPDPASTNETVALRLEHLLEGGGEPFDLGATTVAITKNGETNTTITPVTNLAGREYSFTMPAYDVKVTVTMKQAAEPTPVHTLSTRPLVEGGEIRGGIWAREQYTTQSERPAFAQDGTSARIPQGATVEYYAYEPDYTDTWVIDAVYLARADDPELKPISSYNLEPGYASGGGGQGSITYRTFTMPNYDAVIVVRGGNYPYPVKTESVYVVGSEVTGGDYLNAPYHPLTNNYVAAYGKEFTLANAGTLAPIDAIMPGEAVYVDAKLIAGYYLKEVWLLMEGWAPRKLDLTPNYSIGWHYTGGFLMSGIGRGATVRAIYEIINPVKITYTLPANSAGLRLDEGGPVRYRTANAEQDPYTGQVTGGTYFAQDIVYLYNDNPYERAYKLREGTNIDLGGGVKADITRNDYIGCVGYDVRLTWPTSGGFPANIPIPIEGQDVDFKPARFDSAVPNHTNPEKFESVTVSGQFSAETIETGEIHLVVYEPSGAYVSGASPILNTYKIDWTKAGGAITPAAGDEPATLTLNLKASGAIIGGPPAFSEMGATDVYENGSLVGTKPNTKRAWGIQVGYRPLFTSNAGAGVEYGTGGKAILAFNLHAAEVNYAAPPKYYMSIARDDWGNYAMKVGATEAEARGNGSYPTTVLTFYNEKGFFADDPANPATVQISDEGAQKVSFNGAMFLETYGLGTLKFTKDSAGVHMEAENMRLQALNTPIFVPSYMFAESRTLMMHMYNGWWYSLNPKSSEEPITFAPWGDISMEIAGWTGFAAGIDEIKVTKNTINIKGGLWMTWPFAQEPFGGFGVERLELEINSGQEYFAKFRGIEAEGKMELPQLYIIGGSAYARINTFENDYYFETEASLGPASLGGFLHLKESERLGIWLPNSFYFDVDLGEVGVPLVPPAIVAWITGVSGGISNMVDTIDYDWRATFFPPITVTIGAHFKLVQLLSFHAEITSGFYSMVGTLTGSVEIGKVGVDILDYLTFEFGLFNEPKRADSNCSRVFAKIGVHVGLALSNQYVKDIIKGQLGGAFGLKFDNPLQTGWDAIISYMEDQSTKLSVTDLINKFALEYAGYAYGGVEVYFPQILVFGPFHLASVYAHMNFSVKLNIQPEGMFASQGWVAGRAQLLEDLRGWFAYNMGNEYLAFGHGDLPDNYANLAGITTYSMAAMSMSASSGAAKELGEGLRVLADTESAGAWSPAPDAGSLSLFAAGSDAAGVKIYSGKEGDIFTRRFTLPAGSADYFLALRQLESGTADAAGADTVADADLRLYAPNGAEITLNVWDAEDTVTENDARFVYNTLAGRDDSGNRTWLIALPEDTGVVGAGEWTLRSSRDVSAQLWQQDAMPGIGGVALSGGASANGGVSLNKGTLTIDLENLKPEGSGNGQQNYQYSIDLVRRAAPDGEALATINVPLGKINSDSVAGNDQEGNTSMVGDYYGDVAQGGSSGNGSGYESKTLTAALSAAMFPDDATPGDYYPEVVLYRYYGTDAEGEALRMPLDRAPGYEPVKVTNGTFADVTVGSLTAVAGQNQSIEVTFEGVSKDSDYADLESAGYLITGYTVAAYGGDGLPAQAMPANPSAGGGSLKGQPADGGPAAGPGYVATGLTLSYDSDGDLPALPAGADDSHTAILTGLTPGQYTAGVTPIFAAQANIAVQSNGVETRTSGAVSVIKAVAPALTLSLAGGVIRDGDGSSKVLCVSPGFELTVSTAANADISVIRYRDKEEMAAATNATSLALSAATYFGKNSATVNGQQIIGGYETLMITAVDSATLGSVNQVVTLVPDLTPPTLIVDNLAGDARVVATTDSSFTIQGRTQPGLTASLLNAGAPMSATSDDAGRFSLNGTLPQDSDGQIAVAVMGASGLTASQTLKVEQVSAADFTALELTPAGTLAMTQGDTLALTVLGARADGSKISLSPDSLTFTAAGSVTVDPGGVLTVIGAGAGTVAARLGALQSNTLQIQAQALAGGDSGTPTPGSGRSGGGGAGAATTNRPRGYIITTPDGKSAVTGADGTITLPGGGGIKTPAGLTVTAPAGTTITLNDVVTPPRSAALSVTLPSGLALNIRQGTAIILDESVPLGYLAVFENQFADVRAGNWFFDDVGFAYTNGLFAGTGAAAFSPNAPMTRGMLVTVLGRLHGIDTSGLKNGTFSDVDAAAYYAAYVEWAREAGVVSGVGGNNFAPGAPISRQDLAVILHNYMRFADKELPRKREYGGFIDDGDIVAYAREAVSVLYRSGVIGGKPGNLFDPKGPATRAEAAAMLRRFIIAVSG
ncbi:MAG: S-layer homology domain-containing protein [Peptococcaceae bacterium]|jgi:hypothetical protein|nr:S-layer homology domain-containing protein [Peptococcaceae bacterium]